MERGEIVQEQISAAYLMIEEGSQAGKRIEIWKEHTTIGRSRNCDIFLEDVTVHRKQASILFTHGGYFLRDDHGSGDSLVNGKAVREQRLHDGDQLLFGNTRLTFYSHEATRPFQQLSSRGKESHRGKVRDPNASTIGRLNFTNTRGGLQSFELRSEVTIGRSRDCSIFLEDLAVSRLHAIIRQLPDETYELIDQGSATGTFVNGQPISRCRLIEGDIVQIGASRLIFRKM
jgi:pSer/pThr/pTyr-binding forkhead associated (FHA) protein